MLGLDDNIASDIPGAPSSLQDVHRSSRPKYIGEMALQESHAAGAKLLEDYDTPAPDMASARGV